MRVCVCVWVWRPGRRSDRVFFLCLFTPFVFIFSLFAASWWWKEEAEEEGPGPSRYAQHFSFSTTHVCAQPLLFAFCFCRLSIV
ncbi:hypothetical protein TRSC58_07598 [Trypanosoma rangeli SC58]|uniref:Uncharacterized protein n=1 Tax=Trypanosoma rangeli SC58 TaxID=429131 RepID=A0A061IUX2_TRYRA|nr:hypothetical protein TRSC58_07598 [Trypanosoma rangeli SC58]